MTRAGRARSLIVLAGVLVLAAGARWPGIVDRSIWYDEAITLLESAGHFSPAWPERPTAAGSLAESVFRGSTGFGEIRRGVERTDIHPPGYVWALSAWRSALGWSLETARYFSLLCSLGSIVVLYRLLREAEYEYPLMAAALYGLTAAGTYYGHEARAYALATLLILLGALSAYVASERRKGPRTTIWAASCGAVLGLAFHVHYLTLFTSCAILLWFSARRIRRSPKRLLWVAGTFAIGVALALPTLSEQFGTRPDSFAGFPGLGPELLDLIVFNGLILWSPTSQTPVPANLVFAGLVGLLGFGFVRLRRNGSIHDRPFWLLVAGLSVAPSLGVFLYDLTFDRHLLRPRYLAFAAPALSVFLSHGVAWMIDRRKLIGYSTAAALLVLLWMPSWSSDERGRLGFPSARYRAWAGTVDDVGGDVVVALGAGHGRGAPAAAVYELAQRDETSRTDVQVIERGKSTGRATNLLSSYRHVWVVPASDGETAAEEMAVVDQLTNETGYEEVSRFASAVHLVRRDRQGWALW